MNKLHLFLAVIFTITTQAQISYNDLEDGTSGIANGYGSWGANTVIHETEIDDVANDGIINFYHPDMAATQLPTVFFISGWGRPASSYEKIFHFIASQGYAVVSIYNRNPGNIVESYQFSLNMMVIAAQLHYANWIDTTTVGLMGHSYGAGATIWLGKNLFGDAYNWGQNGRFIFMSAPWYSLLVTQTDLINYPANVKLLIEISNDDVRTDEYTWNTDERAIRAIFELINIPNSEKDFVRIYSDPTTYQLDSDGDGTTETFSYEADHYLSYTGINNAHGYQPWDALDVYAINRLSHAMMDFVFEGNQPAKNVVLGNGSTAQIDMNFLTDLSVTDTPIITRPANEFAYRCNNTWNDFSGGANTWFLQNACNDTDGDGIIDLITLTTEEKNMETFHLYPIPTSTYIKIRFDAGFEPIQEMTITNATGKIVSKVKNPTVYTIDTSNFEAGTYFVKIQTVKFVHIQSFIVKK